MKGVKEILIVYALYIIAATLVLCFTGNCRYETVLGLTFGIAAAVLNYYLLCLTVQKVMGKANVLAAQIVFLRYLLYAAAGCICIRYGEESLIMYAVGIIGLSVSIIVKYGIGVKES